MEHGACRRRSEVCVRALCIPCGTLGHVCCMRTQPFITCAMGRRCRQKMEASSFIAPLVWLLNASAQRWPLLSVARHVDHVRPIHPASSSPLAQPGAIISSKSLTSPALGSKAISDPSEGPARLDPPRGRSPVGSCTSAARYRHLYACPDAL